MVQQCLLIEKNLSVAKIINEGSKREKSINIRHLKSKKTIAQRECDSLNCGIEAEEAETKYSRPRFYNRYSRKNKVYEVTECKICNVIGPYAHVINKGGRKKRVIRFAILHENRKVVQQQNKILNYCNNKRK